MIAISLACTILLAGVGLVCWASSHSHLVRTPEQVRADMAHYRAQRDHATCEAIAALPTIPNPRKENGQ
ncbi:hypothetical protein [Streptomyces sp. NPDC126499]|uniref:hypothetical protein n=1 Tax=Streptomyces sp. NPDC126499 TaxID=3155314 RepID=UPI003321B288